MRNNTMKILSLILTGQLFMELSDECELMHKEKQMCNRLVRMLETSISKPYSRLYDRDHVMVLNSLNIKQRMIEQIAKMDESEAIRISEYINGNNTDKINLDYDTQAS